MDGGERSHACPFLSTEKDLLDRRLDEHHSFSECNNKGKNKSLASARN
jgi:hypothetical protein